MADWGSIPNFSLICVFMGLGNAYFLNFFAGLSLWWWMELMKIRFWATCIL